MGQEYTVLTVPWVADPSKFTPDPKLGPYAVFMAVIQGLTLDDFKWNAEQFNKVGAELKKSGLQLAYHNHNFEFKKYGDTTGYDALLHLTDPELVKFEMDCGWVTVAGHSPVEYLHKHPNRYRFLHIKDFKAGFTPTTTLDATGGGAPVPTELGRGMIDYKPILAAAKKSPVRAYFIEQEPPFTEMPALGAIKIDYRYLHDLHG